MITNRQKQIHSQAVEMRLVKAHLRVEHEADDFLIQRYVESAAAEVTELSGIGCGICDYVARFPRFPRWCDATDKQAFYGNPAQLILPVRPLRRIDKIVFYDLSGNLVELASHAYYVVGDSGVINPTGRWPAHDTARGVEVHYSAGYSAADLPRQAWHAILLIVGASYSDRGDDNKALTISPAAMRLIDQLKTHQYF